MSLVCTTMSPVCHSYVLVCHPYFIRMYSYVIHISLVCTQMPFVWHLYVLVRHSYVTRMYSCAIRMSFVCTRMSLVCGFTMNLWKLCNFKFGAGNYSNDMKFLKFLSQISRKFNPMVNNNLWFFAAHTTRTTFTLVLIQLKKVGEASHNWLQSSTI